MSLQIESDSTRPAYAGLEEPADKIGVRRHFGTHIGCYTSVPTEGKYNLPVHSVDCRKGMFSPESARILEKNSSFILIDSYGIGNHAAGHIALDKQCEASGCYVIENIYIHPDHAGAIKEIHIRFDLDYPSTGKPCKITVKQSPR